MTSLNQGTIHGDEHYGPDPLQTLGLCVQNPSSDAPWLIYIHGGAWHDPLVTKSTAHPLLHNMLLTYPTLNSAALNYRLSPHPSYPDLPNTAQHPDHLDDVLAAILYLQSVYKLSAHRYVLVGHSAGATLAFQVLPALGAVGLWPASVVGAEGIYDLEGLVEEYPDYGGFIKGAFGGRESWKDASPRWAGCEGYEGKVVLIQSDEDELLTWRQTMAWRKVVDAGRGVSERDRESKSGKPLKTQIVRARGTHDEVPQGKELADVTEDLVKDLIPGKLS